MKRELITNKKANIQEFRLPRYSEIPNVGLYLEQVAKYINGYLDTIGCMELTPSMISNYVKKGIIANPIKKLYYAEQIAYLFFVAVSKSVLSIENISVIIKMQKEVYGSQKAYDYFCDEFEHRLAAVFAMEYAAPIGIEDNKKVKSMLQSVLFAAAHMIYLNDQFADVLSVNEDEETDIIDK